MSPTSDLVVLGAGPAGLWAARRAAECGHDVVVIERASSVGGLAGSFTVDGIRVDHGSHRLHAATDPQVLADLHGLLDGDLQVRPRRGRIRIAGRWLGFPLTPAGVVRGLPPGFAARALLDAMTAFARHPRDDTFAEVVRSQLGDTMLRRFYGPYARKLWGLAPDEISGEQARRRIGASSTTGLLRKVLRGTDPRARTFLYPRRGFGQLWEAVADAATGAGADLRLQTTATGLAPRPEGGVDVHTDAGTVQARWVWSTVPVGLLPRLWQPGAPATVQRAADALTSRAMVLVYLVLDGRSYTPFDAHYLPEAWTPVTRISEPTNYRDSDEDPTDRTVLCAEIPCQVGDAVWRGSEDGLAAMVGAALRDAQLPAPRVRSVEVRRVPHAYPVLDHGAEERLAQLEAWAGILPGVLTLGRQGLFAHDNTHHAIAMAEAAVAALGPDGVDRAAWDRAREGFRTHVVED